MRRINLLHPVTIFIASLLALGTSLYLYIDSYIRVNESLREFINRSGLPKGQFKEPETWVMILTLSILVALIVTGMSLVFVYYQKVIMLYRMQQNFINGFTHELKTPIASLRIFIDTLVKHELTQLKRAEILQLMKSDTDRLQENVEQILNLAKIEDRNFKPELKQLNVKRSLEDFVQKQSYLFEGCDINIGKLDADDLYWFDPKLLDIVFMNLLTNAIRYNNSEQKKVDIFFYKRGKALEIVFKDNGLGLKRDKLKNIFKKFYQVGKSAKGSGLGLYMVSQIFKVHKSKVWATSEGPSQGSSFHLLFTAR
jgi:signal transduction histidine kinase